MSLFAERYIKIKIILLKIGIWPTDHIQKRTVALLILQIIFCLCVIVRSIMVFDKRTASDAFAHFNGSMLVITYYCVMLKEKQSFSRLMCEIDVELSSEMNEIEVKCMRNAGRELNRILKIAIYIYACAGTVKYVQPFILVVYTILFTSNGDKTLLPQPMALPIIHNELITYALESILTTIILASIIGVLILFIVTILYLCAQFEALREMLIEDKYPGVCTKRRDHVNSNRKLNRCIKRHIKLIELSTIMANSYGPTLWANCLLSMINICFLLFSMASQQNVGHTFTAFLLLSACLFQLFLANWFSDRLRTASIDVSWGAYSSRWTELDSNYQKKILFIIQRSQKPLTLKYFGNFTPSLEVFVNICTTAWGYFNIMRTVVQNL